MIKMVKKAAIAEAGSSQSINLAPDIIITPTMIRAGDVAKAGIPEKRGISNMELKNRMAATTAVKPLRPPSEIPEADSI